MVLPTARNEGRTVTWTMRGEARRHLENAKACLRQAPVEGGTYTDIKYVQEACGTAYLAVLKAIDAALIRRGVDEKDLPQAVEAYREALQKHWAPKDGKWLRDFEKLYKLFHIAGYYRALLDDVKILREVFTMAETFIRRLGA